MTGGQWSGLKTVWRRGLRAWCSEVQSPTGGQSQAVYCRAQYWSQYCSRPSFMTRMTGQSTLLTSLQWYKTGRSGWYIQELCCYSEWLQQAGAWSERTLRKFSTSTCWVLTSWRAALPRSALGSLWITSWPGASSTPLRERRPTGYWTSAAGGRRRSLLSTQHEWGCVWSIVWFWAPQY